MVPPAFLPGGQRASTTTVRAAPRSTGGLAWQTRLVARRVTQLQLCLLTPVSARRSRAAAGGSVEMQGSSWSGRCSDSSALGMCCRPERCDRDRGESGLPGRRRFLQVHRRHVQRLMPQSRPVPNAARPDRERGLWDVPDPSFGARRLHGSRAARQRHRSSAYWHAAPRSGNSRHALCVRAAYRASLQWNWPDKTRHRQVAAAPSRQSSAPKLRFAT